MQDDDDDDDRVKKLFEALDGLADDLTAMRDKLAELNSMFPATREFLRSKGVTNVMELSPEDRRVLMACLQAERDALLGDKKPSN
ncbi:MAG TPA: hypothetical protein VL283_00790 [Candidatus Baltobacteraceae bacterium]|jgi:hypothetical protein|nr:hypothetical protein [Candidatus Baltobacteraceae bacterium]